MICRNASVLALHRRPTIFAGAPFRLRNICRNGVPPRSRTTTPLHTTSGVRLQSVSVDYDNTVVCIRAFCMYVCAMQWKMETRFFRSTTLRTTRRYTSADDVDTSIIPDRSHISESATTTPCPLYVVLASSWRQTAKKIR